VAVVEDAPQADMWSVCISCTTFEKISSDIERRAGLGDSGASCLFVLSVKLM